MIGAFLAVLSAASFAVTIATGRRAVFTGTPAQGMALSNPVGVICFLVAAVLTGEITRIVAFPSMAAVCMACVGILHFVFGRYASFKASQSAGANLTSPVIQLNVVVTLGLAVIVLGERCTVLQIIGGIVMLSAAVITQQQSAASATTATAKFSPRYAEGFFFALLAAAAYGTSPIMTRSALQFSGPSNAITGGLIAYVAATTAVAIMVLFSPALRRNLMSAKLENVRWFAYSGVAVAIAQGFLYGALSLAPIMVVIPMLQLSLIFRLLLSMWLNPEHEVFGPKIILGSVISMMGACVVAIDTDLILAALGVPETWAPLLRWQVS